MGTRTSLAEIEAFTLVAELGSFRGAAARLDLQPPAVSKAIARLEAQLGVSLLERTTRSVALTPEGEAYLEHARVALEALAAGEDQLQRARGAPRGLVRISAPEVLGSRILDILPGVLDPYPHLEVEVVLTDREVRVVEEGFDVALRIGVLADSALLALRLGATEMVTAASPAYLARAGTPHRPQELADHRGLVYGRTTGGVTPWRFATEAGEVTVTPGRVVRMDSGPLLVRAACRGLGVVQAMDFMVDDVLASGALVEVLASHRVPGPPVHALTSPRLRRVPRVAVVLEALTR